MSQNEFCDTDQKVVSVEKKTKREKFKTPLVDELKRYFLEKGKPELEAQKFFNHFEANGWKVGGRTPMKNWKAAANNWMLNYDKFNPSTSLSSSQHLTATTDKDYDIPL